MSNIQINHVYCGDSCKILKTFSDKCINMVMTSPPYYQLRDYGIDGQLGTETTYIEYLDKLLRIFSEIKRILKDEGTCFVNLGDSYSGSNNGSNDNRNGKKLKYKGQKTGKTTIRRKSLMLIPDRFAIRMIESGWILRNVIIWHKSNCLPESVKDRFTNNYEKIFFFTKNTNYYFKQQFEPIKQVSIERLKRATSNSHKYSLRKEKIFQQREGRSPHKFEGGDYLVSPFDVQRGRNKRAIWKLPTACSKESHFAVYPEKLCITPILAGCPLGGIVLDPFAGTGTTLITAKKLSRNYIGIDINSKYCRIMEEKLAGIQNTLL